MSTTYLVSGIGYEGKNLDDFISVLKIRGIEVLVDVRLNAISRKRGFSKTALTHALAEANIEYCHLPKLGNVRENRVGYGEIGTLSAELARSTFRETLQRLEAQEALAKITELAATKRVMLFCFEHDQAHCHREQVLEALPRTVRKELQAA